MHILLIHQAFVSPEEAGGTRHYELANYVSQHGHKFTIVASDLSYLTGKSVGNPSGVVAEQNVEGIRVLRARTFPVLHRSFVWRVISFLSFMVTSVWAGMRAGPVDLVMGTSPPIFQAVSAWLIATVRRRPFLLEIRDLWPDFAVDMGILTNPLLISLAQWLERFLYSQATHIVVNSPAYEEHLLQKGIAANKISLIPNGVSTETFSAANTGHEVRQKFGLNGDFVITYAGALGIANDIQTILRAAHKLKNENHIHFLLVGDGKERASLEQMKEELSLTNVSFTGAIPKTQMSNILAASDACVATLQNIPMFATTYPNKVFDYMAAGRPTILAIDGVIRQVIEDSKGGIFVPPGDDKSLADAVLDLASNSAKSTQMGSAARNYVEKHFDRRQQAEKFKTLLEWLQEQQHK